MQIPERYYQLVSTGIEAKKIPTDRSYQLISTDSEALETKKAHKYDNDLLIEQLGDLTNTRFHSWYCSTFYKLGVKRVLQLASIARNDAKHDKRKLFSFLLKKEVESKT